ncbi:SIR2 family protein [Pontixanthobacter gangjinensis]|uniref:Novel STAND NTPase 5 domain-containing protein n=1 Tax=Pontixanthobacter gangjinensis TaxID=1028742 RepID=A0A6I4SRW6_9SPHN|nr:SIR2 family protein [Pontixanthobacter gangjinensis]MXO57860.1 hypothetical protein [Pontixanthobacter gangjinensis]
MTDLPPMLIQTVRDQRAILFLGAGANYGAKHPKDKSVPVGDGLKELICDEFFGGRLKDKSLIAVSAMALSEAGFSKFQRFIRDIFEPYGPADYHLKIPKFRWRAIASTNFDLIIEKAYAAETQRVQNLVKTVKNGDEYDARIQGESSPVGFFKLHGCVDHYTDDTIPLVLGNEQYASYSQNRERFYERLRDLAYENSIIFAGYSLADPHIQQILFDVTSNDLQRPSFYCVGPDFDDIEIRYWARHRVTVIKDTLEGFLTSLDAEIPDLARKVPLVSNSSDDLSISKHYRTNDPQESDELKAYLLTDVSHVHSGYVSDTSTAREFYSGHDQGWSAIIQNYDVKRKIVDSALVDAVLFYDDDTSNNSTHLFMMKGPAGNGKTVALKRIAWEAATSYDKLVLYADGPASIRLDPLKEIFNLVKKRIYLFVDHIALFRNEVVSLLKSCQTYNIPLTVIGAERDNEWHTYCEGLEAFLTQDFPVRYLSEIEIRQLVDLLERHNCLGVLSEKTPEERITAFVSGAERQLLVALHEVTLGLPFEKIVLDEYERIEPPQAKQLYLEICALHQFGAPVRAGLISRSSGISFEDFRSKFVHPLDNVVKIVEDKHTKDLSYQARHSQVAAMVFSQALPSAEEKYDALASLLGAMNVDYNSDRETFSRMIKGRNISEIFADVSLGRLFYDRAEEAAPGGSFVAHQRAVFELNHQGGSLDLAENACNRALKANAKSQSIKHTLAEVFRRKANESDDPLLKQAHRRESRKWLSRDQGKSSAYDLNTRARMALDVLRDVLSGEDADNNSSTNEILIATKEAELAISSGRQAHPESAELLSSEASLHELLNDDERAIAALKRAFQKNPRQDWLAARLARKHRNDGDCDAAIAVLEACLRENSSSKMGHLELGHCLKASNGEAALVLDHFRRSFTQGDTNYEGQFWYARELFLQDQFAEATKIFDALHKHAPGRFRSGSSAEVAGEKTTSGRLQGELTRLEEGYGFIKSAHLPDGLFASRAYTDDEVWPELHNGDKVTFSIAFNRRGPNAINVMRA